MSREVCSLELEIFKACQYIAVTYRPVDICGSPMFAKNHSPKRSFVLSECDRRRLCERVISRRIFSPLSRSSFGARIVNDDHALVGEIKNPEFDWAKRIECEIARRPYAVALDGDLGGHDG